MDDGVSVDTCVEKVSPDLGECVTRCSIAVPSR